MRASMCFGIISMFLACGCGGTRHYVIAATGTVIGVEIARNPASQFYEGKVGYNRGELALVPTNRTVVSGDETQPTGAEQCSDVVMELRYGGFFDAGPSSGIYQRLAVGKAAVSQPGAAFMFARSPNGDLDKDAAAAISRTFGGVKKLTGYALSALINTVLTELKAREARDTKAAGLLGRLNAFADRTLPKEYTGYTQDRTDSTKIVATKHTTNPPNRNLVALNSYLGILRDNESRLREDMQRLSAGTAIKLDTSAATQDKLQELLDQQIGARQRIERALEGSTEMTEALDYFFELAR